VSGPDTPVAGRAESGEFVDVLVAFAGRLRGEGMAVGSGDVLTYTQAMAAMNPADLLDLYWGGRTTLVTRRDQISLYDRVFRAFFLGQDESLPEPARVKVRAIATTASVLQIPATEPGPDNPDEHQARMGLVASHADILRDKAFAACTPEELAALRRIMAAIRLTPPRRRTRRTEPANSGRRPDPRRTVRETMRRHGEPTTLLWRRRRRRPRPLVLIQDDSG
jgi:uncharacterized protein with von Willebrand factor type A (vWA) domain